ncbi:MAG: hypothetical protein II996_03280 [Oscillospiraceae bacterium]|nr:hypothetical protein [Oscillospiraceae bacterium]
MNITQHKINNYSEGVSNLPDYPSDSGYTAESLKAVFDARSDKEIKEKHNALIDELSEILTKQQERIENITGASVVSAHDDLASILPADKEMYIIKYDSMPVQDKDGNVTVSDEVVYVTKIGDGVTSLAELPQTSTLISGIGTGSLTQFTEEEAYGIEKGDGTRLYPLPVAEGYASVALGRYTKAVGDHSSALNYATLSEGDFSHAEGGYTKTSGLYSHAEGHYATAEGWASHAENSYTKAIGKYSHAEGHQCEATGERSHAEGTSSKSEGSSSHAEGHITVASGLGSHSEGHSTTAEGEASHAEGNGAKATGKASHAEGSNTTASGAYSHSEGSNTKATGDYSHAEGASTEASGKYSHAEGASSKALNNSAHAEGFSTTASGQFSHAEGRGTVASGDYSHAAGLNTVASGGYATAMGYANKASGSYSFASGYSSESVNTGSTAMGVGLKTGRNYQTVFGLYNKLSSQDVFQIGNGTSDEARSNIFSVNIDKSVKLGNTVLSEAVLSDMLTHGERIRELEETISALAARLDAYIAGGGEVPEGVATSFVTLDMFNAHVEDTENPHKVTSEQVNVDLTGLATTEYVVSSIQSAILDSWEAEV